MPENQNYAAEHGISEETASKLMEKMEESPLESREPSEKIFDDEIQDAEIVEEIVENASGTDRKKKVCSICGKPAFCQNKKGDIYLCEKHYIAMAKEQKKHYPKVPYERKEAKIGRNDKCTCGSGLKYKKCCGKS